VLKKVICAQEYGIAYIASLPLLSGAGQSGSGGEEGEVEACQTYSVTDYTYEKPAGKTNKFPQVY